MDGPVQEGLRRAEIAGVEMIDRHGNTDHRNGEGIDL
jgi:hypothetical protein